MISLILFIVFFVLWGASVITEPLGRYSNALAWISVGLLAFHLGVFHF